jgi:hypothetical protein
MYVPGFKTFYKCKSICPTRTSQSRIQSYKSNLLRQHYKKFTTQQLTSLVHIEKFFHILRKNAFAYVHMYVPTLVL